MSVWASVPGRSNPGRFNRDNDFDDGFLDVATSFGGHEIRLCINHEEAELSTSEAWELVNRLVAALEYNYRAMRRRVERE